MRFHLIHEVGNRQRWKTASVLTRASAELVADELSTVKGVAGVKINPRTGSVVVFYETAAARAAVCSYFDSLQAKPPMLRDGRQELVHKVRCQQAAKLEKTGAGVDVSRLFAKGFGAMPVVKAAVQPFKKLLPRVSVAAAAGARGIDLAPLVSWVAVRPLMPLLVQMANAVIGSIPILLKGLAELRHGKLNVEVLDASAIAVSLLRRDFKTASLVVLLLGLGEMLERYTRKKSLESLADQLALKVDKVWIRRDEAVVEVPLKDVGEGDVVVVRAGSTIPVDGKVVAGTAAVNQATMTGEPLAVARSAGSVVFAGTVVEDGEIDVLPTQIGKNTRLNQIIHFIENSEQSKAGIQGKAERLADAIVPYNFALAGLVFLLTRSLTRTAAVLLVDYSCALRLATPLAILTAMKEGTREGMLIKGGRYLEALSEVDTVVFDKTGTLTAAAPELTDVISLDAAASEDQVLSLAACLEEHFPHPVSRAVVQAAAAKGLYHADEPHDAQVRYIVAHGICSSVQGQKVIIGSRHFVEDDEGVDCSAAQPHVERLALQGKSILYMVQAGVLIGLLGIIDPVRAESREVICALRRRGIKRVVMLTGDDRKTARAVAERLGIDEFEAQVLPVDKASYVQKLRAQGCRVLMVGDGINDSPALSSADVGATLREGSAIAQEVADLVLTRNTLQDLPRAIDLGRASMARVKENFGVSVGLNTAFMAGGLVGLLQPALGAVLHNLTTIGVCLNAMRSPLQRELNIKRALDEFRKLLLMQGAEPMEGAVKAIAGSAAQDCVNDGLVMEKKS